MNETVQIVLAFIILLLVIIFAKRFRTTMLFRARDRVLNDLRSKGAVSKETAIDLPYAHSSMLKVGLRDDRPKILRQMIQYGVVEMTEEKRFFLNESALKEIQKSVSSPA